MEAEHMDPQADNDSVLQKKQKLTNIVIGFIFLLSGIEYAVILPTVWMYLQTLDAQPFFLGLVLSAFSLTELLSGPVFGYWSDRTGKTKHVILFSNCFEIAGNFMYFVGISKWFLLASRLVAGIGGGAGASIFGYLTQHSSAKERVPVFAMAMACRQAGLLIGPAFNIFLRYCTFQLGPFHVDKFSAPGIFMCVLWTLIQFMVIFMFYDGAQNSTQSLNQEHEPLLKESDIPSQLYGSVNSKEPSSNQEDFPAYADASMSSAPTSNDHLHVKNHELDQRFHNVKPVIGLLREDIVVLLTAQFVTFFNQTALETLVTPLAQKYLAFQDLENSLLYFLCGIEQYVLIGWKIYLYNESFQLLEALLPVFEDSRNSMNVMLQIRSIVCISWAMLIGFLVVRTLSRCCTDRLILAFGLFISIISCIWCLIFLAEPKEFFSLLLLVNLSNPSFALKEYCTERDTLADLLVEILVAWLSLASVLWSYGFLLAEFIIGVFLQVLALPFVSVSQVSLFSKVTAENTQGFNHGIRRSVGGVATILGPLWAAGLTENLYIMLGVMMGLLLLITILFSLSYKYLVEPAPLVTETS